MDFQTTCTLFSTQVCRTKRCPRAWPRPPPPPSSPRGCWAAWRERRRDERARVCARALALQGGGVRKCFLEAPACTLLALIDILVSCTGELVVHVYVYPWSDCAAFRSSARESSPAFSCTLNGRLSLRRHVREHLNVVFSRNSRSLSRGHLLP